MSIKMAIFDLDGTLLDSVPDLADALNVALANHGFTYQTEEQVRAAVGHGVRHLVEQTSGCTDPAIIKQMLAEFASYYRQNLCNRSTVYDGIEALISYLSEQGIALGVFSNKPAPYVELIVSQLFGKDTFDLMLGQRDAYPSKPDASQLLEVLAEKGIATQDCCYIGDSEVDVATAQNAGLDMIAVLWGYRSQEELQQAGATRLASDAKTLEKLLLSIEK